MNINVCHPSGTIPCSVVVDAGGQLPYLWPPNRAHFRSSGWCVWRRTLNLTSSYSALLHPLLVRGWWDHKMVTYSALSCPGLGRYRIFRGGVLCGLHGCVEGSYCSVTCLYGSTKLDQKRHVIQSVSPCEGSTIISPGVCRSSSPVQEYSSRPKHISMHSHQPQGIEEFW